MRDPYEAVREWERAFNSGVGDAVARLYTPDAVLWGTLAKELTPRGTISVPILSMPPSPD